MSFLDDFHFIRPAWLLLVPIASWVWWNLRKSKDPLKGWRAVIDEKLLEAMKVGPNSRSKWRDVSLLAAWLIAIVAVAGPTWQPEPSPFADDPVPVMLVLKAGETMNLSDLTPSRMERARLKVSDFANERKGKPLGLIAYAGSSHLVLPPTRDTSVVASMAAEISPAVMPKPGDHLADALRLAERTLGEIGGSIVVVADTAQPVAPADLEELKKNRLPVYFLAVARADTPEFEAIQQVAKTLGGDVTLMSPDLADVQSLVKSTARAPVAVSATGEGTRWAEAGWSLIPLLALFSLASFRRVQQIRGTEGGK